ncbi:hypothetical protein BGZ46_001229 [Entomortierella lignicola]|nr:hypothetical protein BGZ46_001229 [Entomortierella lignicola]
MSPKRSRRKKQGFNWSDEISLARKGAEYFHAITGRLKFNPSDYISSRGLVRRLSSRLQQEWDHWMRDLKKSKVPQIKEAAFNAPRLTTQLLDDFCRDRIVADRELAVL